jgi:hypothetical protein
VSLIAEGAVLLRQKNNIDRHDCVPSATRKSANMSSTGTYIV